MDQALRIDQVPKFSINVLLGRIRFMEKLFDSSLNLIADLAEHGHFFFVGARRLGRIGERPVDRFFRVWQSGTRFLRRITHRHNQIDPLIEESVQMLAVGCRQIFTQFGHRFDRQWMNVPGRSRARRIGLPITAAESIPEIFGHLRPT